MFGVGLQFHIEELLAVRRVAIPGAVAQSAVATLLGAVIARAFGWSWAAGIVFGMALAVASTVVLIRVLADHRDLHTPTGHIAVGWLVVEDLFTVLALVLLPVLFADGGSDTSIVVALGRHRAQSRGARGIHGRCRQPRDSICAGPRCRHRIARALYAHCADARPRHCRRLGRCLRRLDGARCVSRRPRRRPIGLQPACGVGSAADARRVRCAVFRLGRHAAVAGVPARGSRSHPGDAGGRDDRQAAHRARDRPSARISVQGGAVDRRCARRKSASSRSSSRASGAI